MRHELIPLSCRDRWTNALRRIPHAFGHTWENCTAMQLTTGLPTFLFSCGGDTNIVCPIMERDYHGYKDIVTPYGFSGFAGDLGVPGWERCWREFVKEKEYVCGYVGLNPLLVDLDCPQLSGVWKHNEIHVLDLRSPLEELFANLSQNRRRQLKDFDSMVDDLSVVKGSGIRFLLEHYHPFFEDRGASPVYYLSTQTLDALFELENVILVSMRQEGQVVAASVFAHSPHIAEYLFNVSVPEGRRHAVPLLWRAIVELKRRGIPILNLGGGVREGDSIADFKSRFGGRRIPLGSLREVYDRERYVDLCRKAGTEPEISNKYFPSYRNPGNLGHGIVSRNGGDASE